MKKKLKIYSALLVTIIVIVILPEIIRFEFTEYSDRNDEKLELASPPSWYQELDTVEYGAYRNRLPTINYDVWVRPNGKRVCQALDAKMLLSTVGDQTYTVEMQRVLLSAPAPHGTLRENLIHNPFPFIATLTYKLVMGIVIIWIFVLIIRIIRDIRRGEVFVKRVSRALDTTGLLLVFLYLYQWISSYLVAQYLIKHILLADYHVVFHNDTNSMYLITGLALMIVSQVILMGKDLKEEQDLTI